jgi:DNA-binding winged helix-turn-helix (wHTH) protein
VINIRVLGTLEASVDRRPVRLGALKPRAVLAILALHPGEIVSTERLIEGLWGEEPPATAVKLVQLYVSQLRKALTAGGDGKAIVTRGHGYQLQLAPTDVDAGHFEQLLAEGAPREALALIVSAILLPVGPALAQGRPGPVGDRPAEYFSGTRPASVLVGDRPADYFSDTTEPLQTAPSGASGDQQASGFDWLSAGIGAAAAGVLIVISLGGATAAARLHWRTTRS